MKRIGEFEKILVEKISQLENQNVEIKDFRKVLKDNGTIEYYYESALLSCDIIATYNGFKHYGNKVIELRLSLYYL